MKVDDNGMCTLSEEDSSYHSCNIKKNICSCYHAERNFLGEIGVCWGTKECEACSCDGDESKCDFYEYKRKRARQNSTNADSIRAMTWIPLKEHLPEKRKYVLARFKNNDMGVVCWFDGGKDVLLWKVMTDDGFCSDLESEPTHWIPLPEPPKEE